MGAIMILESLSKGLKEPERGRSLTGEHPAEDGEATGSIPVFPIGDKNGNIN